MSACSQKPPKEKNNSKAEIEYDGFVDPNSLSPEYFRGRHYLNATIDLKENNQITINDIPVPLEKVIAELEKKSKIIEQDDYKAFLNIGIRSSRKTEFDFYKKWFELISDFRTNKIEAYAKRKFGKSYLDLTKAEKKEVNKTILINLSELEPY